MASLKSAGNGEEENVPPYISNLPPPSEDEKWRAISEQFSDLSSVITSARLETKSEAKGKKVDKKVANTEARVGRITQDSAIVGLEIAVDCDRRHPALIVEQLPFLHRIA